MHLYCILDIVGIWFGTLCYRDNKLIHKYLLKQVLYLDFFLISYIIIWIYVPMIREKVSPSLIT